MDGLTTATGVESDLAFVRGIAGFAGEVDRTGGFPRQSLDILQHQQLLGITARMEDGGENAGLRRASDLVRQVGRGCASTGLIFSMQLTHLRNSTGAKWPQHLREQVGRSAVREGALINALRVEPALGSPARGGLPETVARRTPSGWSMTGRKIYSTGVPGLTWMLVFARTDGDDPRMGLFLVPGANPGIRIEETWDQLGLRGSGSHDVVFDGATIPHDHAVDVRLPAQWKQKDADGAAWSGLMVGSLYTGVAEAARDWIVAFLRNRVPANLGKPLATLPRMQEAVGRIEALLLTNRRLIAGAAADTDAGMPPTTAESGLVKTITAENAISAVQEAVQLAGNHALSRDNPLERHLRDVLCARVHTPQPDAALTAAGRITLGQ
jgi:alkylation response protein AidB-like acyl-CoA dehydrogenase